MGGVLVRSVCCCMGHAYILSGGGYHIYYPWNPDYPNTCSWVCAHPNACACFHYLLWPCRFTYVLCCRHESPFFWRHRVFKNEVDQAQYQSAKDTWLILCIVCWPFMMLLHFLYFLFMAIYGGLVSLGWLLSLGCCCSQCDCRCRTTHSHSVRMFGAFRLLRDDNWEYTKNPCSACGRLCGPLCSVESVPYFESKMKIEQRQTQLGLPHVIDHV